MVYDARMILRRNLLRAAACAPFSLLSRAQSRKRPNIVLIVSDDQGYSDAGFQGSSDIRTPHLDALARGGVRFSNGYVTHPFCSPSRAGLLTGRYQHRFGHENNMLFDIEDPVKGLPLSERTLADALAANGYATGLIGKWHLGSHPKFHPTKRGFREMYGFVGGGHDYLNPGSPDERKKELLLPIHREDGKPIAEKEYLTTALGREASAFVRRHPRDPFFLYLAFNAPHSPLQITPEWLDKFSSIADPKRRAYAAMMATLDDSVGKVVSAVREQGREQDTLFVFLSDNGGPRDNSSNNHPLRGTKRTLYEGGIRVPFLMNWVGRIPGGKTLADPVSALDMFPTILSATGIDVPKDRKLDGLNLMPYVQGKSAKLPARTLHWRTFGGKFFAVREGRWKLFQAEGKPPELYDLDTDAPESNNLAAREPKIVARLETARRNWNRQMVPPLWPDHIYDLRPETRKQFYGEP